MKVRSHTSKSTGAALWTAVLSLTFGLLVWALHLTLVYGVHTLACARSFTPTWIFGLTFPVLAIMAITVVALLATVAGAWWLARRKRDGSSDLRQEHLFDTKVINWVALLASIGMFWAGAAALFVSPCLALR